MNARKRKQEKAGEREEERKYQRKKERESREGGEIESAARGCRKEADWKIGPDMRIGRCSLKIWAIWTESGETGDTEIGGQKERETGRP